MDIKAISGKVRARLKFLLWDSRVYHYDRFGFSCFSSLYLWISWVWDGGVVAEPVRGKKSHLTAFDQGQTRGHMPAPTPSLHWRISLKIKITIISQDILFTFITFAANAVWLFIYHLLFLSLCTVNPWGQSLFSPPLWAAWCEQDGIGRIVGRWETFFAQKICKYLSEIDRWMQARHHTTPNPFSVCFWALHPFLGQKWATQTVPGCSQPQPDLCPTRSAALTCLPGAFCSMMSS